jgi:Na+/proline symporter/CheY-like chemotaxis protein/PAS domain-containing protein
MVVLAALVYLTALFAIAHVGESRGQRLMNGPLRSAIYALTLGVYCTSWTFLGSVGLSSRTGYDFIPIYLGPVLVIGVGSLFFARIVKLAKDNNISSIADFVSSRYGKSQGVAATVTLIAVIGVLPYIALQLKAISASLAVFLASNTAMPLGSVGTQLAAVPVFGDISLLVALVLAFFAIVFGTRQVDTTEHQDGLMIAVAMESAIKLMAFVAAGIFVTWWLFDGPTDLLTQVAAKPEVADIFNQTPDWSLWFTMTLLSAGAIIMLPRQFHVAVIENRNPADLRRAAWMFPLYLIAINLFVIPIAMAGLLTFPDGAIDRDLTVLALPLRDGAGVLALVVLIGGLSAATAMVIVECVALAIMISNDLFMPLVLSRRAGTSIKDMSTMILVVRRVAIILVLLLGYAYYRAAGDAALASIGLLAFAAIAQIGPAFVGGLFWSRANARGAVAGLLTGIGVWAYTLLLPSFGPSNEFFGSTIREGIFSISWMKPDGLFGLSIHPLVHGVLASLAANILAFVGVSLTRQPNAIERVQANVFLTPENTGVTSTFRLWRSTVTVDELRQTVARYLGEDRTRAAFQSFATTSNLSADSNRDADAHTMRFAEHLLASAIGASSSRLVMSLMLRRRNLSSDAALRVLDDASAAIQQNRALLQHALDHTRQGVTVFDKDLRLLACNRAFLDIFDLPPDLVQPGVRIDEIIAFNARRGLYGEDSGNELVAARLESLTYDTEPVRLRLPSRGMVIDIRSNHLPDGGRVTTYTDITESVQAEEELEKANETLERRVQERTEELTKVNTQLSRAKADAEEANLSKTRFLAAASHDILQPLNAARLYTSSLVERVNGDEAISLARNADASLDAVEEILTALLDISRLDSGAMKPEFSAVQMSDIFRQLAIELAPMAKAKGLPLTFMPCSLWVKSDRRLLRRLLQNLISNALKYTPSGRVLVGCRRRRGRVQIEVRDTGIGIPPNRQKQIFREFQRLDEGALIARGLGLGLSIVERIARVLDHKVSVVSLSGKGSVFALDLPAARAVPAVPDVVQPVLPLAALTGLRVACIDNEPTILEGMRILLEGWGCVVTTSADELGAIAQVKKTGLIPDALIADYHLDRGHGLSAIRELRKATKPTLKAILLTADRTAELRDKAALINVPILNKPLKPAALRAWLSQIGIQRS